MSSEKKNERKTLKEIIVSFMKGQVGGVATLKQIYNVVDDEYETDGKTVHNSARALIYRHEESFKRVCKGVYMLKGEHSTSLLINGDGRKLEEVGNGEIDGCIITDHPWDDKKSLKGGNRDKSKYELFRYTLDDFKQKARVLKKGSFLVEFLPIESATNIDFLYEIKQMAKQCGLRYYTHCIWRTWFG